MTTRDAGTSIFPAWKIRRPDRAAAARYGKEPSGVDGISDFDGRRGLRRPRRGIVRPWVRRLGQVDPDFPGNHRRHRRGLRHLQSRAFRGHPLGYGRPAADIARRRARQQRRQRRIDSGNRPDGFPDQGFPGRPQTRLPRGPGRSGDHRGVVLGRYAFQDGRHLHALPVRGMVDPHRSRSAEAKERGGRRSGPGRHLEGRGSLRGGRPSWPRPAE